MSPETHLEVGDTAPTFTLVDADGNVAKLSDYASRKVIVYFCPSTSTPGCTGQACDFRDSLDRLNDAGLDVVGIYPAAPEELADFRDDEGLTFALLSDPDLTVSTSWGAVGAKKMFQKTVQHVISSTFVVDEKGRIEFARYSVKSGHTPSVIQRIISDQNAWPQAWTETRQGYASEQET